MKDFTVVNDAGETIVLSRNKLIHVEKEVMDRVRPAKFRTILRVDSSIPDWVEQYSYDKIVQTAEWLPAQEFTEEFATASTRVETAAHKLHEMVSGYRFNVREMVRAQKMGMNLDASRAAAVMAKGETVLEHLAADGTINGTKQLGSFEGVYNTTGASIMGTASGTSTLSGYTTSWKDQFDAAGSTDDYDAACEAVMSDILSLEDASEVLTKETTPIDTVVLPLSVKTDLRRTKTHTERSLEDMVLMRAKHIKRIMYWYKADENNYGVDGTHKRRIVGLAASDVDAARFVLPKAPTPGRPVQITTGGIHVPVGMVVGGFNTKMPSTIIYADLADDS